MLIKPQTNPDHNAAHNWRPSAAVNGNPGGSDVANYATWKSTHSITSDHGDDDQDGVSNITEFLMKSDPGSASSRPAISGGIQTILVDPGPGLPPVAGDYLTLTFDRDPAADEVDYFPEISTDNTDWSGSLTDLVRVSVTPNPGGTQTEIWRSTVPATGDRRRYGRVRITAP